MIDSINTFIVFIKENKEMHFAIFIITGIFIIIPDWLVTSIIGVSIPPSLKVAFFIFFIISTILATTDLLTGKWRKKEKSTEYKELETEFKDKEIIKKIKKVCVWKRNNPNKGEYKKQYNNPEQYPDFDKIHNGRRDVMEYYQKIMDYSEVRKLISPDDVKSLVPKNRINILLTIFEPIEKEMESITNNPYDPEVFRFYEDIKTT